MRSLALFCNPIRLSFALMVLVASSTLTCTGKRDPPESVDNPRAANRETDSVTDTYTVQSTDTHTVRSTDTYTVQSTDTYPTTDWDAGFGPNRNMDAAADVDADGADETASNPNGAVTWKVDSEADWNQAGAEYIGIVLSNGEAAPVDTGGTYSSVMKGFEGSLKPRKATIRQSVVWDNWVEVTNVGPPEAEDAPVFIPVANDDYYLLGLGSTGGYHAWHSTDMVNWTDTGKVTDGDAHRWVTSAEYKDGSFYILEDKPNDEDPHLWIDNDLTDGQLGTFFGMVFNDPSHGSDAGLFRDDSDGLFHIIYEDWTPINARKHSWDSPLAGHTSSEDCINGFEPHEHVPVVDYRTTPTGETGTYSHPSSGTLSYEIHEPEQPCFGDWTMIKIGSQYYLFGDYEEVLEETPPDTRGPVKIARFTSSSLYQEFELVGSLGKKHPDPTVGFAEGQFYLITQQEIDYVSPGPWVEAVQLRVGVDVEGNGTIDTWTPWHTVSERYDHKPGYARVVDVSPAELDLSDLPEGHGFKFELNLVDRTSNESLPIVDSVEIVLEQSG